MKNNRHFSHFNSMTSLLFVGITLFLCLGLNAQANPIKIPLARSISQYLSPHLSSPTRREKHEQIKVEQQRAEIWRYESFERGDLERKLCLASRSLLFGRLPKDQGIKPLFNEFYQLREISLVFYKIKTTVNPNLQGFYEQTEQTEVTARLTLQRETLFSLDLQMLKTLLQGPRCVERAKEVLSDLWISEKIMERREALSTAEKEVRARWPLQKKQTQTQP